MLWHLAGPSSPFRWKLCVGASLLIAGVGLAALPQRLQAQASGIAGLGAAELLLTQVSTALSSALNSGDLIASNRINHAAVEAKAILKQIEAIKNGTVRDANRATTEVFASTQSLLVSLRSDVRSTERRVFLDVNSTLANSARLLDGIPFVNVSPFVVGVEPTRLSADPVDREVFIYGYFKFVSDKIPATVWVGDSVQPIPLKKYTNNRLGFTLPLKNVKEESYINLKFSIPDEPSLGGWWTRSASIYDRIYVERRQPYSLSLKQTVPNSDLWEVLTPSVEIHENADSNRTSNDQVITAPQALARVKPDALTTHIIESAKYVSATPRFGSGGPCDHVTRGHSLVALNDDLIHFRLHASSMGAHSPSLLDHHGGGGSHADIWFTPSFRVKKRNVPESVDRPVITLKSVHSDVKIIDIEKGWMALGVLVQYRDGDEQWTESASLTPTVPSSSKPYWDVGVADNNKATVTLRKVPASMKP